MYPTQAGWGEIVGFWMLFSGLLIILVMAITAARRKQNEVGHDLSKRMSNMEIFLFIFHTLVLPLVGLALILIGFAVFESNNRGRYPAYPMDCFVGR